MGYNILVVDDSPIIRGFMRKTLELTGLEIETIFEAKNGQEGLDQLEKNNVHIVFADINMPVMTGVEMVNEMFLKSLLPKIPVVIISSDRSLERQAQLKEKGVRAYLKKPITPENVKKITCDLLELGEQRKECLNE